MNPSGFLAWFRGHSLQSAIFCFGLPCRVRFRSLCPVSHRGEPFRLADVWSVVSFLQNFFGDGVRGPGVTLRSTHGLFSDGPSDLFPPSVSAGGLSQEKKIMGVGQFVGKSGKFMY